MDDRLPADLRRLEDIWRTKEDLLRTSAKPKKNRVMSSFVLPPTPVFTPGNGSATATSAPTTSPVSAHETHAGPDLMPSIFMKQASIPPPLTDFTPTAFRVWLMDFRTFLTRFQLQHHLDVERPSSAPLDPGATTVIFLLEQAFQPVMASSTAAGELLALMWKVHYRRSSAPATTIKWLLTHLSISSANEMDELELVLSKFTPTINEQLEHFIWRLHLALDDYNRQALLHNLPIYSERRLFRHLLRQLPTSVTD